ncbi:MAG: diguanylate cyclase response regulator [Candidatus Parabeggiatoa sp. nov. 3]|nr:MAG: diguanylate cyclase response regulator [Gammaproteobacteria bacterium]RKZ66460.1 MAG: diguanylate cyclase response regulator [Gammaproteobacteria bacterium]RKZ86227.1 MAG: diguanylate cyclase response regulator [Gammaproteobacteria bacterium]
MTNHDEKPLILIVDDNQQNLQMLGSILKEKGYRPAIAQDGTKALEFVQKKHPDMILLDIMMPDMDGIEVCQHLKKQERTTKIPVIFITALFETSEKLKAFKAGGVDYITKPFVAEEVLARINVHIELKKALEKLEKMSITDELTGVFNRRFAYEILAKQIEMAKKECSRFVVCYLDVDNLKKINDTYNHAEGDKLINSVVNSLKGVLSASDYLCRMGGDEFLILFPKLKRQEAHNLIEALRIELNQHKIGDIPIDFSFGLSEYHAVERRTPDELIKMADACMYQVKMSKKMKP